MVPLVFKTSERRAASLAGSIPVRLRHQRILRASRPRTVLDRHGGLTASRARWNIRGTFVRHDAASTSFATASAAAL